MSEEILIVEDDRTLAEVIATSLERVGFTTRVVDRGDAVTHLVRSMRRRLRVAESHDFDLLARFWSSHGQPVRPALVVDVEID
jgi:DNA-binding response OmpR family regulator